MAVSTRRPLMSRATARPMLTLTTFIAPDPFMLETPSQLSNTVPS
jgi:hypothetical protein